MKVFAWPDNRGGGISGEEGEGCLGKVAPAAAIGSFTLWRCYARKPSGAGRILAFCLGRPVILPS